MSLIGSKIKLNGAMKNENKSVFDKENIDCFEENYNTFLHAALKEADTPTEKHMVSKLSERKEQAFSEIKKNIETLGKEQDSLNYLRAKQQLLSQFEARLVDYPFMKLDDKLNYREWGNDEKILELSKQIEECEKQIEELKKQRAELKKPVKDEVNELMKKFFSPVRFAFGNEERDGVPSIRGK